MNINSQSERPLPWEPHELSNYDETLTAGCATELQRLAAASSQERLDFIIDPREVHRRLYATLTPDEHPEYAGNFRGSTGTSLEQRRIGATRETDGLDQEFARPEKVLSHLLIVEQQARKIFQLPIQTSSTIVLQEIVKLFYAFGLVHPFLDGNGHIQRLIFAACVMERKPLRLRDEWTIHPRPYDMELKLAFEAANTDLRIKALFRVLAEYVSE